MGDKIKMETNYGKEKQLLLFGNDNQNSNSLESRVERTPLSLSLQKPQKEFVREYLPGRDFYIPKYKYELVNWLNGYCDRVEKEKKNFEGMKKKQLYAIYFSIRKKGG